MPANTLHSDIFKGVHLLNMNRIDTQKRNENLALVCGGITCDLPYWPSRDGEVIRGGKNQVNRIEFVFGGFGINASVALRHAFPEFRVILNSVVGNHKIWKHIALWEQVIKPYLEEEGVELSVHVASGERMTVSIIEANGNERTIFTESHPQTYFNHEHVAWDALTEAKLVLIGHIGVNVSASLIEQADAKGALVAFNPGRTQLTFFAAQPEVFSAISQKVFVLQMNSQEAGRMMNMPHASNAELLYELANRGQQRITVLTDGNRGCLAYDRRYESVIEHPACLIREKELSDPTGAGDHHIAVLAGALLESGGDLKYALSLASVYAAESTLHPGGCGGELRHGEENEFLDAHSFKGEVRIWSFAEMNP